MRLPVPSPAVHAVSGFLALGVVVFGRLALGSAALLALSAMGAMSIYTGLLWIFNANGAWDRWMQWRTGDEGVHPGLLGLTRRGDLDSRWVSGPMAVLVGAGFVWLGVEAGLGD